MTTTKVLMVDSSEAVRRGIRTLIEMQPDIEVVADVATLEEAVQLVSELAPRVVLMEVAAQGLEGLSVARQIVEMSAGSSVLFLTQHESYRYFFEALRTGCRGYILKSSDPEALMSGIRAVARGQAYIDPRMAKWLVKEFTTRSQRSHGSDRYDGGHYDLTSQELGIMDLVAEGLTNREIATRIGLGFNTVRRYRARLMRKLGVHTAGELVCRAMRSEMLVDRSETLPSARVAH